MKDRAPKYPGRVKLTPVPGEENLFDLTRADEPTQYGTPLNTATLLKQQTAALFGLGEDAVPDDVFSMLSRFHAGLGNEYLWAKTGTYLEKVESPSTGDSMGIVLFNDRDNNVVLPARVYYGDAVLMDDRGDLYIPEYQVLTITEEGDYTNLNTLIGKRFYNVDAPEGKRGYYKCTSGTPVFIDGQLRFGDFTGYEYSVVEKAGLVGYVNSPDPNAYPPAVDDGFAYNRLGQLGGFAKIATGSYVGTGGVGASNPIVLNCESRPFLVVIEGENASVSSNAEAQNAYQIITISPSSSYSAVRVFGTNGNSVHNLGVYMRYADGTLSWYGTYSASYHLNVAGDTYKYTFLF